MQRTPRDILRVLIGKTRHCRRYIFARAGRHDAVDVRVDERMIALTRMSKPRCKVATSNHYNFKSPRSNVIHGFEATYRLNLHNQAHPSRRLVSLVRAKYCFGFHQPLADVSNLRAVVHVMKHHVYCADPAGA